MTEITLQYPYPINQSCQEGDLLYYTPIANASVGGFTVNQSNSEMILLGPVKTITNVDTNGSGVLNVTNIVCEVADGITPPTTSDFIFFKKDNSVNEASITGYYGEFVFENNSKQKAELFTAACEITESSK